MQEEIFQYMTVSITYPGRVFRLTLFIIEGIAGLPLKFSTNMVLITPLGSRASGC